MKSRPIDARQILEGQPFSYRGAKDGTVFLEYHGRVVKTLSGNAAARFLSAVENLESAEAQLLMAKLTGNFKRGNEQ
jgi:hypothetical protein